MVKVWVVTAANVYCTPYQASFLLRRLGGVSRRADSRNRVIDLEELLWSLMLM